MTNSDQLRLDSNPFVTKNFQLSSWQKKAVDAWRQGDGERPYRGTMEVVTGGGKTLIALACVESVASEVPDLRVAIVVPTETLARQWRESVLLHTHIQRAEIGILGAGKRDDFVGHRVLIAVINSARDRLPELARDVSELMLVVDECHRAGSPKNSRVLTAKSKYTLGLSATPDREELDETGQPVEYDEHLLGRSLGEIVFAFSLRDARDAGWLPEYKVLHHGLALSKEERDQYEALTRKVDDVTDRLEKLGFRKAQLVRGIRGDADTNRLIDSWTLLTNQRKDLLFRAEERRRVALRLVKQELKRSPEARILLFNERVAEAIALEETLRTELPQARFGLEHSELPARERERTLEAFRKGDVQVLVSVKALIEGLDVPEIDVALSIAATSSVRQRIQSLGRALRRRFDSSVRHDVRQIHILYVHGTADEEIYGREDWSDLTGAQANRYFKWEFESDEPIELDEPPRTPRATEEQEWERLGRIPPAEPSPWLGVWPDAEFSVDTRGNVTDGNGRVMSNPQGVNEMIGKLRKTPAGRFRVTPVHRLVLVRGEGDDSAMYVVGQLKERFTPAEAAMSAEGDVDSANLAPGDPYPGPTDSQHGTFKLSQRGDGMIERKRGRTREFAFDEGSNKPELEANARRVLNAWQQVGRETNSFSLNSRWDAWYRVGGQARFLTSAKGGFSWPDEGEGG
jgi:superfamily II DNA or RNA helicase